MSAREWKKPRNLRECLNIGDLRELARRRLPGPVFHFLDGAAETEFTARRNTEAFDEERLIPRCRVDVSSVSTATRVLGRDIEWPVFCSPTGASRFFHPLGEVAVARAAAAAGTAYSLSMMSTCSMEEVSACSSGPKVFQLDVFKDRQFTLELIERCKRLGYTALCLTVDTPVGGKRERDLRTGLGIPPKLSGRSLASFAAHPRWLCGQLRRGPLSFPNVAGRAAGAAAQSEFYGKQLDPSVTWLDVRKIMEFWGRPFAIKGIMSPEDARRAVDAGATTIIVSNHGGRQLDGAAAPIEVLADIAKAVGQDAEVILDGGVRRGSHVFKALARGARACSVGRPYLFGLAAGGEKGVAAALRILRSEFERVMILAGCNRIEDVNESFLARRRC